MSDNALEAVETQTCPICKGNNACASLASADAGQSCWCHNPEIEFPQILLDQVPEVARGKSCICQACALAYQKQKSKVAFPR